MSAPKLIWAMPHSKRGWNDIVAVRNSSEFQMKILDIELYHHDDTVKAMTSQNEALKRERTGIIKTKREQLAKMEGEMKALIADNSKLTRDYAAEIEDNSERVSALSYMLRHTNGKELRRIVGVLNDTSNINELMLAINRRKANLQAPIDGEE